MKKFHEWLREHDGEFYRQLMDENRFLAPVLAGLGLLAGASSDMGTPTARADITKTVQFKDAKDRSLIPFDVKIKDTGNAAKNAELVLADVAKEVTTKHADITKNAKDWAKRNTFFQIYPTADPKGFVPLVPPQAMNVFLQNPAVVSKNANNPAAKAVIQKISAALKNNGDGTFSGTFYLRIEAWEDYGNGGEWHGRGRFIPIKPGRIIGIED